MARMVFFFDPYCVVDIEEIFLPPTLKNKNRKCSKLSINYLYMYFLIENNLNLLR